MARKKVSLEQKAEALAIYEGTGRNASATARLTGFSHTAIQDWANLTDAELLRLLQRKKQELGIGFATLTEKLLKRYNDLANSATLDDKGVTLLGICADKALLYAGQPTEITEHRVRITVEEAERDLQKFLPHFLTRAEAIEALRSVDPDCAAALAIEAIEVEGELVN